MQRTTVNPPSLFNSLQYGFSQAVVVGAGRRVLLSGQVAVDAEERTLGSGLGAQTAAALDNVAKLLAELGATLAEVAILRIYVVDSARDQQEAVAETLRRYFPSDPPASSWIFVSALSEPAWLIEIEAEAVLPQD